MLRKKAAQYGVQWDKHLPIIMWAYRNTSNDTTGEKPAFLLFEWDCRSPSDSALLPPDGTQPTVVPDYRHELIESLRSASQTALQTIRRSHSKYKKQCDRKSDSHKYRVGDWVLIHFPGDETGKFWKLSRPWYGPYRITSFNDYDISVVKVYFPRENEIKVHQSRVKPCPDGLLARYYWYEHKSKGPGRLHK